MTTATAEQTEDRTRWLALYVLCAGMLMIVLDATIVNVALPTIQDDLGFSQSKLAWVVNAYMIPFGGLLLLAGRVGALAGPSRAPPRGPAVRTPPPVQTHRACADPSRARAARPGSAVPAPSEGRSAGPGASGTTCRSAS